MKTRLSIVVLTTAVMLTIVSCKPIVSDVTTTQNPNDPTYTEYQQFQAWKAAQNQPVTTTGTYRSNNYSGSMSSTSSHTGYTSTKKRGWSKAAKYSVIGGAGGAVLGAVINKRNRLAGGVIGGVLGAGGGYLIGRHKDRQQGRY